MKSPSVAQPALAAFFALPAIALGMIAVGDPRIGFALLIAWAVVSTIVWLRRKSRRVDPSNDEIASGVVPKDVGATLQVLLDALPKAGARWVRVAKTSPPKVRAGTCKSTETTGVEIEVVLSPVSASETRVDVVSRPVARSSGNATSESRRIVQELSQSVGLTWAGGTV